MSYVPIQLLTGFLGSGKTTLLNHLLKQSEMASTLVIINEFGDIGLDHLLVTHSTENQEIIEVSGGCICCNLRSDLKKTLKDIAWRFSRQGKKQFDRVLIETTGLAEPAPLLHTIMTDAYIASQYRLDGVITTFDAMNGMSTLSKQYLSAKQLAIADCILVTKTDLIDSDTLENIHSRLSSINPAAKRYEVQHGMIECEKLLGLSLLQKLLDRQLSDNKICAEDIQQWLRNDYYRHFKHPAQLLDDDAHAHDDINAFSVRLHSPVTNRQFENFLALLYTLNGNDLLRVKGIFHFLGQASPSVFHAVQHVFHPLIALPDWYSQYAQTLGQCSQLVFVTHDIPNQALEAIIQQSFGEHHQIGNNGPEAIYSSDIALAINCSA